MKWKHSLLIVKQFDLFVRKHCSGTLRNNSDAVYERYFQFRATNWIILRCKFHRWTWVSSTIKCELIPHPLRLYHATVKKIHSFRSKKKTSGSSPSSPKLLLSPSCFPFPFEGRLGFMKVIGLLHSGSNDLSCRFFLCFFFFFPISFDSSLDILFHKFLLIAMVSQLWEMA